ncbi:hypothetical protein PG275_10205 [Riemerella anatipestifer]|uniref:tellurite resistance TerB family protein n=1 Tax=Riemerella anatipestifer TaxID=34085 RepID=UPI002A86AECB|nr:hypothetical protein [Riemerella anatipestifer]
MSKNLISWDSIMDTSLSMPLVKIDRVDFLKESFQSYGNIIGIESKRPIDLFSPEIIQKVAKSTINGHLAKVTGASALAGIPGGFALLGTIPADLAQYYWHVLVLAQKLAYIYGYPNLLDNNKNINEETRTNLTLFVGVMLGAQAANNALQKISQKAAVQMAKKLPQKALTKTAYYPVAKQVGKWIGLNVTKSTFAKGASKAIPILGGVLSGGLSYITFDKMASRLNKQMYSDMIDLNTNSHHFMDISSLDFNDDFEDVNYEELNLEVLKIQACINVAKIDFELHEEEITFIVEMIDEADLDDNDKMSLMKNLHAKEIIDLDLSQIKNNDLYCLSLIESLISIVKIDNIIKPSERIYLYKLAKELGFDKNDIKEMLDVNKD